MSSKSKRKHEKKSYNRANTGASVEEIKERKANKTEPDTVNGETNINAPKETGAVITETILTPKELKKIQTAKKKQEKLDLKLAKKQGKLTNNAENNKKKEKKETVKKQNIFAGISSELKKVHWPSWNEAWKATGIVLGVVVIFGLVVFGIDRLLGWLYEMLIGGKS
jgi:preprotein translocase subunit SecE